MAFVNLPPNLQDIFYSITDRIAKLETGPNQAMYTAESAQSVATTAQIQAINAGIQANIAQAQATLASTQATAAQISANGKNTVTYSASTPSGSGTTTGDIWFQYDASASYNIKGQWVWNGSSWQVSPIANTVIANLDAGKITTGTITSIEYNNGSGTFKVTPAGALTASSATISGTVNATGGYFGDSTNYWSIGAGGVTGVGTASITGGAISGSSITTTTGRIGGWYLGSGYLSSSTSGTSSGYWMATDGNASFATINASGFQMNGSGALTMGAGTISGASTISATGTILTSGAMSAGTTITSTSAATQTTTAATNCYITTSGIFTKTSNTSSQRYKENITNITNVPELDPKLLLKLPVRAYTYKNGHIPLTDDRSDQMLPGFIAEELDAIYPVAVDYEDGNVETWNGFWLIPAMLSLIQDQEKRIKALEEKLTTTE